MVSAGRVAPVPKGDWNGTTTYYMLDIVTYNNTSWIAKRESLGQTPQDGAYWQVFGGIVPIATTSVAGKVKPDGSTILVEIDGTIYVHVGIEDLVDVDIDNLQPNQVLKWDGTAWVNSNEAGGLVPHLIIISETGSTVTVTKGLWSTTATETSTGHFECDVPEFGTYTIDAVLAGDDAQVSLVVDAVKVYTVDDSHFHADITVTYPSGATVSCSKSGEATMYATGSPYTFTVHSSGTWTITGVKDGVTVTEDVVISTSGQTESVTLSFAPNGSTVVPTDDIQTWLHCGNIWDKAYTTLNEVLADSTTLLALMSDNNAVDYLVRSTTWVSGICANQTAMTDIGLNNYCANILCDDTTWRAGILASTYWQSVLTEKVPTMTGATTPSGKAWNTVPSGSSTYGQAYLAFDGNSAGGYRVSNGAIPNTCYYTFDYPVKVYTAWAHRYSGGSASTSTACIVAHNNDDSDTVISSSYSFSATDDSKYINITAPDSYTTYGFNYTADNNCPGGNGLELQFYGIKPLT